MQANSGKRHLILTADKPAEVQVGESLIKSSDIEKLVGAKIDSKLTLKKHLYFKIHILYFKI